MTFVCTFQEIAFNFLMFLFTMASGGNAVNTFRNVEVFNSDMEKPSVVMGSFCMIASLAYLVDTVFAVILYRK